MTRITSGTIHLFTFKEGMLSAMAHDLRLTVNKFRIQVHDERFDATFIPESIVVDGAVKNGAVDPKVLTDKDKAKIRATMQGEVLKTSQYGRIRYTGTLSHEGVVLVARGELELAGKKKPLEVTIRRTSTGLRGEVELTPTVWGIRPYKALGGALKLKDIVKVTFELPAD